MADLGRERCLLLCMAYPDVSNKYEATYCMAGITEAGEFRRIYPVPHETYRDTDFHKRHWITYDLREKGDYRKESYKIDPNSVEVGEEVSYTEIRNICEDRQTTIEELDRRIEDDDTSLGIIKPSEVFGLWIAESEKRELKKEEYESQTTLTGESLPVRYIPHLLKYNFHCGPECSTVHEIMCEDIEIGMLYWRLMNTYDSIEKVERELEKKFVDWMITERDLYFMMGTHYRWKNWLIVSVLYPKKRKIERLDQFA